MPDLQSAVAALTALVVALTAMVPVVMALWKKVSRQARDFDEFYTGHLLRGKVEALTNDLAVEWFDMSPDSPEPEEGFMPLALRQRVAKLYEPIKPHLQAIRRRNPDATEGEMAKMIERQWGAWLARNVCVKIAVMQWACVVMAISVADGIEPVPESTGD